MAFDLKNILSVITCGGALVLLWVQYVFFSRRKSWVRKRVLAASILLLLGVNEASDCEEYDTNDANHVMHFISHIWQSGTLDHRAPHCRNRGTTSAVSFGPR